jgi:hypothetical protein
LLEAKEPEVGKAAKPKRARTAAVNAGSAERARSSKPFGKSGKKKR